MGKEAYDDYKRHLRDREANSQRYPILEHPTSHSTLEDTYLNTHANTRSVPSSSLCVGDLVLLEKNQRVPANLVLLRTSESLGTCFIRTDQLDGETDWFSFGSADAPIKDIHSFVGTFTLNKPTPSDFSDPSILLNNLPPTVSLLTVENVLWSNTVLAAGSAVGFVI